ncbi:bifunctional oligoribonuclease/PAP phosphatase NrnA [Myxococcota bacterium]|nr:bifunctional oligoribonuclease/PAP phosphatase NrnA [Myxococcota bacterium]
MPLDDGFRLFHALASRATSVLLTGPSEADGDSIGAGLGLAQVLRRTFPHLRVDIVYHAPVPERYRFLPGADRVLTAQEAGGRGPYDLAVLLDGVRHRLGDVGSAFDAAGARVLVDHHRSTDPAEYDLALLEPDMSSTCELVYHLATSPVFGAEVDRDLATNLYAGMIFDTGTFRYSCTTPGTLRVAARLVETGIDFQAIVERILLDTPYSATLFRGRVLAETRTSGDGRVAWAVAPRTLFRELGVGGDATEGVINHLIFITGVDVAMLFVEKDAGVLKVSFRSRGAVNVAEAARLLDPTGGGHDRASGVTLRGDLAELVPRAIALVAGMLPPRPTGSPAP